MNGTLLLSARLLVSENQLLRLAVWNKRRVPPARIVGELQFYRRQIKKDLLGVLWHGVAVALQRS